MSDSNTIDRIDIEQFKEQSREIQEEYANLLGNRKWDVINKSEVNILNRKVACGLYGVPTLEPNDTNFNLGYTENKIQHIKKISSRLIENIDFNLENILFACIFAIGKVARNHQITIPIFKVKREHSDSCVFVDSYARKYFDWKDYLENKELPQGIYCFPSGGWYEHVDGLVSIDFKNSSNLQEINDINIRRNKVTLNESYQGESSLNINPVVEIFNEVCSEDIIVTLRKSTITLEKAKGIANIFEKLHGSVTVNDLKIIYYIAAIIANKERNLLLPIHVHQFATLILFFKNLAVTYENALEIIELIEIFLKHDHHKMDNQTYRLRGKNNTVEKANALKMINNYKDFFNHIADDKLHDLEVSLNNTNDGLLFLNDNLKIDPLMLFQIPTKDQNEILNILINQESWTDSEFEKKMQPIYTRYRISFEHIRAKTSNIICKIFKNDCLTDIYDDGFTPHQLDRLNIIFKNTFNNDLRRIKIGQMFAEFKRCTSASDFIPYLELSNCFLEERVIEKEKLYQLNLGDAKKVTGFKRNIFDRNYGISGGRRDCFVEEVIKELSTEEGTKRMDECFEKLRHEYLQLNMECKPNFSNVLLAIYHYFKHKNLGWGDLSLEEFFNFINDLLKNPDNCKTKAILNQEGNCIQLSIKNIEFKVRCILVKFDDNPVIATVMHDEKLKIT